MKRAARETVAEHVGAAFLRAAPGDTLADITARLARERPGEVELVCAVGERGELLGILPVRRLFAFGGARTLGEVMRRDPPCARLDEDQEHAASLALHHAMNALPVLREDGSFAGVVPAQALLHVLRREHVEDLHRLAGIQRETARARHAIEDPPLRRFWHRIPWLVAGLAGSALATAVMAGFEQRLAANVAIAFFIPAIVYLADAVGTQTEAIAVRGLSLTRSGITHLLAGELGVGTLIGAALGVLAVPLVFLAFGDGRLGLAVGISIWAASTIAATLGLLLPWLLARGGIDPAHGSGPIATVVQDIVSILAYFAVLRAIGI
ncbi:MAG TPA: magnesium transporter [Usitatibacter sp.]|nr:magnesium transporter [Usitatibacter sp.]